MKVGDPKKTAVVAVVAIGAIAFLGKSIMGAMPSRGKAIKQVAQKSAPSVTKEARVILTSSDPFSSPVLTRLAAETKAAQQAALTSKVGGGVTTNKIAPQPTIGGEISPGSAVRPLPPVTVQRTGEQPRQSDAPAPGPQPVKTKLRLSGVVGTGQSTAFVSFDESPARSMRAGDSFNDITVLSIESSAVVLKKAGKRLTLRVGQKGEL